MVGNIVLLWRVEAKVMSVRRTISVCVLLWTTVACGRGDEAVRVEHGSKFDRESGQQSVTQFGHDGEL